MPTYTYKCSVCDTVSEVQHAMSGSVDSCECGGTQVKVLSPTAVMFKGSGFYSTDKGK